MIQLRKRLISWLFEKSQRIYTKFKKKQPWHISNSELCAMPRHTFGYWLGCFLEKNQFQLIPKVERHDAYHVLTGFGTREQDEIALQFLCFGNGKRTPYLFAVLTLGTLILPDYLTYYRKAYHIGKKANVFHHLDFLPLLQTDLERFRSTFFSKDLLTELQDIQSASHGVQLKTTSL